MIKRVFKNCIDYIAIVLLLWLTAFIAMFAGLCAVIFSPFIALWSVIDDKYYDDDDDDDDDIKELNVQC